MADRYAGFCSDSGIHGNSAGLREYAIRAFDELADRCSGLCHLQQLDVPEPILGGARKNFICRWGDGHSRVNGLGDVCHVLSAHGNSFVAAGASAVKLVLSARGLPVFTGKS